MDENEKLKKWMKKQVPVEEDYFDTA